MYSLYDLGSNYVDYAIDIEFSPIFTQNEGCFAMYLDMGFKFYPKEKWPELKDTDIQLAHERMLETYGMNYINYMRWAPDYWNKDEDLAYRHKLEELKQETYQEGLSHREQYELYEKMLKETSCYEEILKRAAVLPENHIELLQRGELPNVSKQDLMPFLTYWW